jgi:hypothetical protein
MNWIRCCRDEQQLCLACLKHSDGRLPAVVKFLNELLMIFLVAPVRAIVMRACVPFLRSVSLEMERLLFSGCMMTLKIQRVVLKKSPKKICLVSY